MIMYYVLTCRLAVRPVSLISPVSSIPRRVRDVPLAIKHPDSNSAWIRALVC